MCPHLKIDLPGHVSDRLSQYNIKEEKMSTDKVSLYAVGDIHPDRPNTESLFELALPTLKQADILFGQLESNLSEKGELQAQLCDIHPFRITSPERVSALSYAGFDIMSFASNHTLDRGEQALFETIDTLTRNNIAVVGVGKNIDEARKPVILERKGTKVAFLAYCSVLPKGYDARPHKSGCAPMKVSTFYEQVDWQPGTPPKIVTFANKDDLAGMVDDITKVRSLADVVVMSIHWGVHHVPAMIAMYQKEVGYAAIDAGVDLILGHHAHILKGIEVYKGKVIFHGLCNFVSPSIRGRREYTRALYDIPEDPEYLDYNWHPDARKSIIAKCVISNKRIEKVSYLPLWINKHAQPEVLTRSDKRGAEVFDYMQWCCQNQGLNAKFSWEGHEVVVST